jgi:hypothetical protein
MPYDRFPSPHDDPFDTEAMRHFWDAVLRRLKGYAEAAEPHALPPSDPVRDSTSLIDAADDSVKHDGG